MGKWCLCSFASPSVLPKQGNVPHSLGWWPLYCALCRCWHRAVQGRSEFWWKRDCQSSCESIESRVRAQGEPAPLVQPHAVPSVHRHWPIRLSITFWTLTHQEVQEFTSVVDLEKFILEHGEQIVDVLGSEVDRIELEIQVSFELATFNNCGYLSVISTTYHHNSFSN